jgi:hypothetical protein
LFVDRTETGAAAILFADPLEGVVATFKLGAVLMKSEGTVGKLILGEGGVFDLSGVLVSTELIGEGGSCCDETLSTIGVDKGIPLAEAGAAAFLINGGVFTLSKFNLTDSMRFFKGSFGDENATFISSISDISSCSKLFNRPHSKGDWTLLFRIGKGDEELPRRSRSESMLAPREIAEVIRLSLRS